MLLRPLTRFVLGAAAAILAVLLLALLWLLAPVVPQPDFLARKGELVAAEVTSESPQPDGRLFEVSLRSSSGLAVELALRMPDQPLPHRPLLVLLGGQETGRAAAEIIPDTHGVVVAALSYPFGSVPHRDGLQLALALGRIQRGILDTPPAVLLALDYLLAHPDLAPERVELAGISFGAYLAAVPAALDQRVDRVWLIHGSGDPAAVLEAGLRKRISSQPLRQGVASLLAAAASAQHLSPERWVARITPRPLVVINATEDSALPPEAVQVLHRALVPPYEVLWTPGDHVHPKRPETILAITRLLFERIGSDGPGSGGAR
ncbi:MAG: hypothetical protein P8Y92_08030 [Halioglobus sp.]